MSILVGGNVQAPRPKRSPKVIVIICLVALLLTLGSGGIFFLLKSRGHSISILASAGTPTPTPTRISTVTPPAQAAFFDTFVNNHLGWDLSNGAGYIRTLANGMLLLTDTNPGTTLVESLPNNGTEVSSITDSDFSTGQIALFTRTGEGSNGITVAISRVEVDLPLAPSVTPAGGAESAGSCHLASLRLDSTAMSGYTFCMSQSK